MALKLGFLALLLVVSTGLPNVMSELPPCVTEDDCLAPCGRPSGCTGQRLDGTPGCMCSAAVEQTAAKNVTKDLPPCVTEDDCVAPCGGPAGCTGQRRDGNPGCVCSAAVEQTAAMNVTKDLPPCVTEDDCVAPCGGPSGCTGQRRDGNPGCVCSAAVKQIAAKNVQSPQPAANTTPTKSADLPPCVTEDDCVRPCGGPSGCTGQRRDGTPGCVCSAAVKQLASRNVQPAANTTTTKSADLSPCVTEDDCVRPCGGPSACTGQRKDGTPGCICKVAEVKRVSSTRAQAATKRSSKAGNKRRSSKAGNKRRSSKAGGRKRRDIPPCVTEDDCLVACGRPTPCTGQRKDGTPGCVCRNHRNKSNRHATLRQRVRG